MDNSSLSRFTCLHYLSFPSPGHLASPCRVDARRGARRDRDRGVISFLPAPNIGLAEETWAIFVPEPIPNCFLAETPPTGPVCRSGNAAPRMLERLGKVAGSVQSLEISGRYQIKPAKIHLDRDVTKPGVFGLQCLTNTILLYDSQSAIAQFEETDLKSAYS